MEIIGSTVARGRTVYALILFLIISALTPYMASASESNPQGALLCTSMGYQWVDLTDQDTDELNTNLPASIAFFHH